MLVDTSIWSLLLRRPLRKLNAKQQQNVDELAQLINDGRVIIIGPIRQELLSGLSSKPLYQKLRTALGPFPDAQLLTIDFERAAEMSNLCRALGVATTAVDMLICSIAERSDTPIFTTDKDFARYAELLGIKLHSIPSH